MDTLSVLGGYVVGPVRTYYQFIEDMSYVLGGHIISPLRTHYRSLDNASRSLENISSVLSINGGHIIIGSCKAYDWSLKHMFASTD